PDAVPPLDSKLLEPHKGEQAKHNQLLLPEILKTLQVPLFLKDKQAQQPGDAVPQEANNPEGADSTPLAVQQSYVSGREAWLRGQRFEAINHLQSALTLAPDEPRIMRLLGLIYTESG